MDTALALRITPWFLGFVSALVVLWVWGSLKEPASIHDEASYLLQAGLFARGDWTGEPPPFPEFFAQAHVLVRPAVASKYFPGHSLMLAPGVALGLPGLIPIVLTGFTGALLYILARRAAGGRVALLAWAIWMASPDNLVWRATYFSELTTGALLLTAWYLLWKWRDEQRTVHLCLIAALFGLSAITRPLTALALAIPVAGLVFARAISTRSWRSLALAFLCGSAFLTLIPVWAANTTGDWRQLPLSLYTRQYIPWDRMGFRYLDIAPLEEPPPFLAAVKADYEPVHRSHTVGRLPVIAFKRMIALIRGVFAGAGWVFLPLVVIGLFLASREVAFAAGSAGAMIAAYLLYPHPPRWTLYYLEVLPVFAVLGAIGARAVARESSSFGRRGSRNVALVLGAIAIVQIPFSASLARSAIERVQAFPDTVKALLATIPADERALVFATFREPASPHAVVLTNPVEVDAQRIVMAWDLGSRNAELAQTLPGRRTYLLDVARLELKPFDADASGGE